MRAPRAPNRQLLVNGEEARRCQLWEQSLGSHASLRLHREQALLRGCARLHGLPSAQIGLSIVNGTDETIDFSDFLNGAPPSPPTEPLSALACARGPARSRALTAGYR